MSLLTQEAFEALTFYAAYGAKESGSVTHRDKADRAYADALARIESLEGVLLLAWNGLPPLNGELTKIQVHVLEEIARIIGLPNLERVELGKEGL